jgi:hypothetical protein
MDPGAAIVSREAFDVVDPAYLVPPDHPVRSSWRTDAAMVLDRELVRLAGMDARCRLVQAKLSRRFMAARAWRPIGFVRLSDYARERLGCSARTLQDDAHVLAGLDTLPVLREALEIGDVSWTQTRLLVRVATPRNESELLRQIAHLTTRELEKRIREMASSDIGQAPTAASTPSNETEVPSNAGDQDGEPVARWEIPLSPRGRRTWLLACEIASRAAGSALSPAQVIELVTAEAAGGEPVLSSRFYTPSTEEYETQLRANLAREERHARSFLENFLAETGVVEGFRWLGPAKREPGPAARLDSLLDSLETSDATELDRRLREVRRIAQRIDYQLATLLRIGADRRLFREIGFATVKLYVESRLGISARRIWNLLAIDRVSWRCCRELREAWREGRLSHLAACTLLPVIDEINGEAWICRAGEVTLRELADEVAWALDSGECSSFSSKPSPPPRGTIVPVGGVPSVDLQEVQLRAHGEDARDHWSCPGAVRLAVRVPISLAALLEFQLDRYRHGREQRWRTFERLLSLAILEWTSVPRHRDPVFERDGWRCAVPGCTSRRNLHDHHVLFRSHGGDNSRINRITLCAAHHLHAVHEGIVTATGRAPDGIEWALGCAPGREPVMRLHGDWYADAA